MRNIEVSKVKETVTKLINHSLINVEEEVLQMIDNLKCSGLAEWAKQQILDNAKVAKETNSFACQDTGLAVIFLDIGQDVHICGGNLIDAVNEGVKAGYSDARKSVADPLTRLNTKTNTPAVIHTNIVEGDKITVSFLAKGAGSENMSKIYMLTPSKGRAGIINAVVDCVLSAGANPCPPIIIGVGIGGTFEQAAIMSKRALIRPTNQTNPDEELKKLESEILAEVNKTNIGIAGFKGDVTALNVSVLTHPTHIGMLPVAVNIQCHSVRHGTEVI